ncbi:class F sortase [Streptomyces bohaiensis]|uniref:class F sortase n=1 Tax=Streptomyces bohaiensis TaxID=1431344 RepID=UPI003B79851C
MTPPAGPGPRARRPSTRGPRSLRAQGAGAAVAGAVLLVGLSVTGGGPDAPADFGAPPADAAEERAKPAPDSAAAPDPVRVHAPRVGLDAPVTAVGVDDDGGAAVPTDPRVAGWYRFGPAPGAAAGSAVLMGHVDSATGDLGEFAALYDLRPGDTVRVDRDGGAVPVEYRVTARETVPADALPDRVFDRGGDPVLTLVTCAPPYDGRDGYRNTLLVTAVPVDD